MKATKIFGGIAVLIIIVVVAAVAYVFFNLNYLVKDAVETYGPQVTNTSVNLQSVDIKPLDGSGVLNSLVIGNPSGFDGDHLLKANNVKLQIDPRTVSNDVIVIKDITIDGVDLLAVQQGLTTNLQEMLKNLQGASSKDESSSADESKEVRLMVENLRFQNNTISLNTESYGSYTVNLPEIVQSNLGTVSKGLTPKELGVAIVTPFIERAKDAAESRIKEIVKEKVTDKAKAKIDAKVDEKKAEAKDKLKEKLGEDAEQKIKDLKNLFGK